MKFLQKIALTIVLCITSLGMGGCSLPWWNTSDAGSGSNPYDPSGDIKVDVPLPGDTTFEEDLGYDRECIQREASATQGVRSLYMPDAEEVADDPILAADRAKFFQNAAYQYEIVAQYILHVLQGTYGAAVGTQTIKYDFYADYSLTGTFYEGKKIRNDDDPTSTTVTLPATQPVVGDARLLETTADAINAPVVNVELQYTVVPEGQGDACPPAVAVTDSSLAWLLNGSDIRSFVSAVQLNLMQLALRFAGDTQVALTDPTALTASQISAEIEKLAKKFDKLGVPQDAEFREIVVDYIESVIIGAHAIAFDEATHTYTDPSYTWYSYEVVGSHMEDGQEIDDYGYVAKTGYYLMLGQSTPHTFERGTIYRLDYHDTVNAIADAIFGTFDAAGASIGAGFVADFAQYSRIEVTDSQPYEFYYNTDETLGADERQYITALEYHDYTSVIMYPDASIDLKKVEDYLDAVERGEEIEEGYDPFDPDFSKKRWLFDSVNICIESREEITVDVYMRVHLRGQKQADGSYQYSDYILHLTRINTDPTQSYDYYPEQDDEFMAQYTDEDGNTLPSYYFDDQKTNSRFVLLADLMDTDVYNTLVNNGIANSFLVDDSSRDSDDFRQFFHQKQVLDDDGVDVPQDYETFHDVFAGKLGSTVSISTAANLGKTLTCTNFYGETVDLGKKYLCYDDCNFVEYIFDVQKDPSLPEDYDYSFKFSMLNFYFCGEIIEDEELE